MISPSFATHLFNACARLCAGCALALTAMAPTFAVCAAAPAGAQTHQSNVHAHGLLTRSHAVRANAHGTRARAHKACATSHGKHGGSHACSPAKGHKHDGKKAKDHREHASGSRHTPTQSKVQTPPTPAPAESPGTTCSSGVDATLNEEGTFTCASGGEPGCQEGFAPVVADEGSTLVCEPEQAEVGGEEEG